MLTGSGVHILFVYGDPACYGRFGFSAAGAHENILHYPEIV